MEPLTYLDTHVVAWLFAGRVDLLGTNAAAAIETYDLSISPMVVLELEYLHETNRLAIAAGEIVRNLQAVVGLTVCDLSFATVIDAAVLQTWTRDPFDRMIVGQAAATDRRLITKDRGIHQHYRNAIW